MVVFDGKPQRTNLVDKEAVRIIELHTLCSTYQSLPRAGGVYDQDPYHMEAMKIVIEMQGKRAELDRKRAKAEADKNAPRR